MFQAIYIASFLMTCSGNLLTIALTLFLSKEKNCGPLIIGLVGFTINFIYTISTLLLARYPLKNKIFIYAPLIIGINYFLLFFSPLPLIFIFLFIGGTFLGLFWPSVQRCFADTKDDIKIGIFNLSWSAGVICGTFLSGFIYGLNPHLPAFIIILLEILAFFILIKNRSTLSFHTINSPSSKITEVQVLPIKIIKKVRLVHFLHFFASGAVFFLYPKLGLMKGFNPQFIGITIGMLFVSRFITFSLLMDKSLILYPANYILVCIFLFISCITIGLSNHPFIILSSVIIMGIAGAFSYHNSLHMHIKYNLKTEIHEGIIGAGAFVGSITAGLLGEFINLPMAYVIIGSLILITGLYIHRY
ncbi:MAG: MFS transporter [bacterium]|nr:MFS transporter [bacterium]